MQILISTIIISLWCNGVFIITDEGQLFGFVTTWAKQFDGWRRYLLKPVILCVTCMASLHGIFISLLFQLDFTTALISIVSAAFINSFLRNIYMNNL